MKLFPPKNDIMLKKKEVFFFFLFFSSFLACFVRLRISSQSFFFSLPSTLATISLSENYSRCSCLFFFPHEQFIRSLHSKIYVYTPSFLGRKVFRQTRKWLIFKNEIVKFCRRNLCVSVLCWRERLKSTNRTI